MQQEHVQAGLGAQERHKVDFMLHLKENVRPLRLDELRNISNQGIQDEPRSVRPVYIYMELDDGIGIDQGYGSIIFPQYDYDIVEIWWIGWDCKDIVRRRSYGETWVAFEQKPKESPSLDGENLR